MQMRSAYGIRLYQWLKRWAVPPQDARSLLPIYVESSVRRSRANVVKSLTAWFPTPISSAVQ